MVTSVDHPRPIRKNAYSDVPVVPSFPRFQTVTPSIFRVLYNIIHQFWNRQVVVGVVVVVCFRMIVVD